MATSTLDIELMLPATLTFPDMSEQEFLDLCDKFPDATVEYEPDAGFFLPDGSRRSPDAAWFDKNRWQAAKTPGIDPQNRTVPIYPPGAEPEVLNNPSEVTGDGPVAGFVLPLAEIF